MKRPFFIFGTRPEAIKLSPLIIEMKKLGLNPLVVTTGQHRDLVPPVLKYFGIIPDVVLDLMQKEQDPNDFVELARSALSTFIDSKYVSYIIVQGDTASAYAGALIGKEKNIVVGHVEAGIRSHNFEEPWPEEFFRTEISKSAQHHFAPTQHAKENLKKENIVDEVYVYGNTVIDALHQVLAGSISDSEKSDEAKKKKLLLSVHRRENIKTFSNEMKMLLRSVVESYPDYDFVALLHPNPDARRLMKDALSTFKNVEFQAPLGYPEMVNFLEHCDLILSDSGGFQEEAAELKIPIVVLRGYTDRPESIGKGAFLVGRDIEKCISSIKEGLELDIVASNPFGEKGASLKVAKFIKNYLEVV